MGLGAVMSSALEAARVATETLQVDVAHEARLGQDVLGASDYAAPVGRPALVQEGRQQLQTSDGRLVTVQAVVSFFPESDGAAPPVIGALDRITLPSGQSGPIVEIPDTLVNPATGAPYMRTVWLGPQSRRS